MLITDPIPADILSRVVTDTPAGGHGGEHLLVTGAFASHQNIGRVFTIRDRPSMSGDYWVADVAGHYGECYVGALLNPTVETGDHVLVLGIESVPDGLGKTGTVRHVGGTVITVEFDEEVRNEDGDLPWGGGWVADDWVKVTPAPASSQMVSVEAVRTVGSRYQAAGSRTAVGNLLSLIEHGGHKVESVVGVGGADGLRYRVAGPTGTVAAFADEAKATAFLDTTKVTEVEWSLVESLTRDAARENSWCGQVDLALREVRPRPADHPNYTGKRFSTSAFEREHAMAAVGVDTTALSEMTVGRWTVGQEDGRAYLDITRGSALPITIRVNGQQVWAS